MTDTQYEPIDEPGPHAQVNKVRGEYVEGDMSETELEIQLENSLSNGPSLCSQVVGEKDWSTIDRLSHYAQAVVLTPLARLRNWKFGDEEETTYYPRQHAMVCVDHEPDPDDHPAESAGRTQEILDTLSVLVYLWFAILGFSLSPIVGSALTLVSVLCIVGPKPTVRYTDEGVGTHVAD